MEIVKLNVGGHRFYTTLATLGSRGENMLTALASNKDSGLVRRLKDEDGFLFLDRDGETFAHVLRLLRDPKEPFPESGVVRNELDYFGIIVPVPFAVSDDSLLSVLRSRKESDRTAFLARNDAEIKFVLETCMTSFKNIVDQAQHVIDAQSVVTKLIFADAFDAMERHDPSIRNGQFWEEVKQMPKINVLPADQVRFQHEVIAIAKREYRLSLSFEPNSVCFGDHRYSSHFVVILTVKWSPSISLTMNLF